MKKFLFVLFGVFVVIGAFAAGENVPTSKSYVDSKLVEKQDIIPANDGTTQVLTNTGTAGEYGAKGIYDANGEYVAQTQNLVDAATMNAGVQNAIDSEFQCIEWADPNDHSSDCLLLDIRGTTERRSPNLFDVSKVKPTHDWDVINNGDGSFSVRGFAVNLGAKLFELAPELEVNKTYTLRFETTRSGYTASYWYCSGHTADSWSWGRNQSMTITENMLDCTMYLYGYHDDTRVTYFNVQITEGATATPYVPYGNLYLPNGE